MTQLEGRISVKRLHGTANLVPSDGNSGGPLQAKTVYPSHSEQIIAPDEDYYGLVAVTVKAVPRLPAAVASVEEGWGIEVGPVVNLAVGVSVSTQSQETVTTALEYEIHPGSWFPHDSGVSATTDPVVTYSFPVIADAVYAVTMTEVGNRLRRCFTAVDPSTIDGTEGNIVSDFVDDSSNLVAGYEFTYTATADGWYLVYVSNQNERPTISVVETKTVWVND